MLINSGILFSTRLNKIKKLNYNVIYLKEWNYSESQTYKNYEFYSWCIKKFQIKKKRWN